jgi:predicted amidohydrolase
MRRIIAPFILVTVSSALLIGCTSTSKALGLKKEAPNEFNILTKAPLVVPPEYNLRPPRLGESSAEDNYSQKAAREALIGNVDAAEPTRGEVVLMTKAGVGRANPEIRLEIDGQNSVERKTDGFTNRILFWQNGQIVDAQGKIIPLDAEAEAKRLASIRKATGGGEVTITKRPGGPKLPGL